ncbi:hypothetical protein [Profundibacterium mesophilum]|uniref:DUF1127 domain-containing protein n=1 Tax=Profundibacterium mesophilum KAUST100406-0324 TaxID=1037889 RepID=A0A921NY08_9RHOB|nr:hypothetical protein [Profundibacterium mesophilum]KAF0676809.1 hypothetical protein PMES_00896 [Profundibacterium mesophilum KAUST100406-0324]
MSIALSRPTRGFSNPFAVIGGAVSRFFTNLIEANSRVREVEFLNGCSDEELARMGLRRDQIVRHVFRDTMFL